MSARRLLAALLLGAVLAAPAAAHKVNLFAYAEDGEVQVEGYFVDGSPSQNSRVEVYGADGSLLTEGTTGERGRFRFPAPPPQDLRIVLVASMGHRNEITLAEAELGIGDTGSPAPAAPTAAAPRPAPGLDAAAVDTIVARRLQPLQDTLVRIQQAQERPGLSEVFGGIGWILGLAGAYLWGVRRRSP